MDKIAWPIYGPYILYIRRVKILTKIDKIVVNGCVNMKQNCTLWTSNRSLSLSLYVEMLGIVRVQIGQKKFALTILICMEVVDNISHLSSSLSNCVPQVNIIHSSYHSSSFGFLFRKYLWIRQWKYDGLHILVIYK